MCCQGPTISPVFSLGEEAAASNGAATQHGFYAVTICVPKSRLYSSVKDLRAVRLPPSPGPCSPFCVFCMCCGGIHPWHIV